MSCTKNITVRVFLAAAVLACSAGASFAQKATVKFTTLDKKTNSRRSEGEMFVRLDKKEETVSQVVMGRGQDSQYKNARFLKTSTLKDEQLLKPLKTEAVYYNKSDKVIGGYTFEYDYAKKLVTFTRLKEEKKEDFQKQFAIQGPICDALNLPVFLERFLILHENLSYDYFYLLSNEPKLYKVNIFYRGIETIEADGKPVKAKKIQLIADMGPLTPLAAKYLPKTYLWFSPQKPYQWLKYEGLERGHNSANIIINTINNEIK